MRSQRRGFLPNITLALNCLLVFLVLFENRIVVPAWLQVAGRSHPLVLHFPIALLVLYVLWQLVFSRAIGPREFTSAVGDWLLLLAAFSSAITAVLGMLLSRESGYDPEALMWHKWAGIILSLMLYAWYTFRKTLAKSKLAMGGAMVLTCSVLVFAGHQGAGITHGQNFLLAPVLPEKQQPHVPIEEALVFEHMVKPIFEAKCMGCHNNRKAKGNLVMETRDLLLKGGRHGKLWDTLQPDLSLLLQRIHLPPEQKKHMPPQGKPQLTDDEMQVLSYWIRDGASFTKMVKDLDVSDTLHILATRLFRKDDTQTFDFEAADEGTIRKLSNVNRVILPAAIGSPALAVNFYNPQYFSSAALKELSPLGDQVISLNLARMPVTDDDLVTIGQFKNLRHLNLNFTSITGKNLSQLKPLRYLEYLSIANTAVSVVQLRQLEQFPALNKVYAWGTPGTRAEVEVLNVPTGKIHFDTGFPADTMLMKLTPPVFLNGEQVLLQPTALQLKHYIKGAEMRYTIDGSDPDSVHGQLYDEHAEIRIGGTVKARAFKPGWLASDIVQMEFAKSKAVPDSVVLLTPPDPKYAADGGTTLKDLRKGDFNISGGTWLGYHNNPFEAILCFEQPLNASSITLCMMKNVQGYILPPAYVEVWGGDDSLHLRRLARVAPPQPQKPVKDDPAKMMPITVSFSPGSMKYIRIKAAPVPKLPKWHGGKGEKGWIFLDEVLVN